MLCFHSRWFHLAYVFVCAFQATYNGSKFYATVYGKRNFVKIKTERASQLIARKLASREVSPRVDDTIPEETRNTSDYPADDGQV